MYNSIIVLRTVFVLYNEPYESGQEIRHVKKAKTFWNEIFEWIDSIVITVMCLLLVFTFIINQVRIDGTSMYDTLEDSDRVLVTDMFYKPKNGDIVVVSSEVYDNVPIIKRIIAVAGQWVDIKDGKVYVGYGKDNLTEVDESYLREDLITDAVIAGGFYGSQEYPLMVPAGKVFVLGDNRPVSLDSRTSAVGLIDERQILGKALYRVYPFNKLGSIYD